MNKLAKIAVIAMILGMMGCAATSPKQAAVAANTPSASSVIGQASAMHSVANAASSLGGGVSPLASQTPALAGLLAQQLGITPTQAMGGAGSIFSVARQIMSPTKFGMVNNAVPGMSQMLAAAPSLKGYAGGAGGGLLGSAASALGGGSRLGQMAMLASSFQSLGLNTGMINQFIPVILQYVQTQGGPSTMGLLQSALMH